MTFFENEINQRCRGREVEQVSENISGKMSYGGVECTLYCYQQLTSEYNGKRAVYISPAHQQSLNIVHGKTPE